MLLALITQVPTPDFATASVFTLELSPMVAETRLLPVLLPVSVSILFPENRESTEPVLVRLIVAPDPLPEASNVASPIILNPRSDEVALLPVY